MSWIGVVTTCSAITEACLSFTMSDDGKSPLLFPTEEACIAAGTSPERQRTLSIRLWAEFQLPPSTTISGVQCEPAGIS